MAIPKKEKKAPFKIITDAPAFRGRLGELTGNELKVWMYLWLHTNGELTAFPSNKTMAKELGIDINTVKIAKRGLRTKGWTSRENQRVRADGGLSTVVEKVHLPWAKNTTEGRAKNQSEGMVENCPLPSGEKICQQKEYSFEVSPAPSAPADSAFKFDSNKEDSNNNNQPVVVVVPSSNSNGNENPDGLVSGYTQEQIAAHAEACKLNAWVHVHDSPSARKREGFVEHLMSLDPPRKALRMKSDGVTPLPDYRQDSGERQIMKDTLKGEPETKRREVEARACDRDALIVNAPEIRRDDLYAVKGGRKKFIVEPYRL